MTKKNYLETLKESVLGRSLFHYSSLVFDENGRSISR